MTKRLEIFLIVGFAVAIVALIVVSQLEGPSFPAIPPISHVLPKLAPLPATGEVDDAINSFLREAAAEEEAFSSEQDDLKLLGTDSQALIDLGASYVENEF